MQSSRGLFFFSLPHGGSLKCEDIVPLGEGRGEPAATIGREGSDAVARCGFSTVFTSNTLSLFPPSLGFPPLLALATLLCTDRRMEKEIRRQDSHKTPRWRFNPAVLVDELREERMGGKGWRCSNNQGVLGREGVVVDLCSLSLAGRWHRIMPWLPHPGSSECL
ncbi:unnamed protein product, partial [Tuber aestivum]